MLRGKVDLRYLQSFMGSDLANGIGEVDGVPLVFFEGAMTRSCFGRRPGSVFPGLVSCGPFAAKAREVALVVRHAALPHGTGRSE